MKDKPTHLLEKGLTRTSNNQTDNPREKVTMLSTGKKTHPGTLPQSQALENQAADIPHGSERNGFGPRGSKEPAAGTQLVRGEPAGDVNPAASPAAVEQSTQAARGVTLVFVLASGGAPLMPCHPARAREFLRKAAPGFINSFLLRSAWWIG